MMTWTREQVLKRIEELSEDDLAPSTSAHPELRWMTLEIFGSWSEASDIVGVETRDGARNRTWRIWRRFVPAARTGLLRPPAPTAASTCWCTTGSAAGKTPAGKRASRRSVKRSGTTLPSGQPVTTSDRACETERTGNTREFGRAQCAFESGPEAVRSPDRCGDAGLKTYHQKSLSEEYDQKACFIYPTSSSSTLSVFISNLASASRTVIKKR